MSIQVEIGNHIKKIRGKKGLTQLQLAERSELNRTFINHVENGRRNLSVQSLEKILKGLEVPFSQFFRKKAFESHD